MDYTILIAEDEPKLREVLSDYFVSRGDRPITAADGIQALELAREAIAQERFLYAAQLLRQTPVHTAYLSEDINRRRLLLLGTIPGQQVSAQLPSLDRELLLRAEDALTEGKISLAAHLLESMEHQESARWHLLRGKAELHQRNWIPAAGHLEIAETVFPREVFPLLETCYRESGDFQKAYEYACKQRK